MRRTVLGVWLAGAVLAAGGPGCSKSGDDEPSVAAEGASAAEETADESRPAHSKPGKSLVEIDPFPRVALNTSLGEIVVELDRAKAPRTVRNFLYHVENGHYNGTIFHEVDKEFAAIGGSQTPDGPAEQTGYPIESEADNGLNNVRATIAMAREIGDIDSATREFFLNLADNPHLDHRGDSPESFGFCVFGKVVEGMSVLKKLANVPVKHDPASATKTPEIIVSIKSAKVLR